VGRAASWWVIVRTVVVLGAVFFGMGSLDYCAFVMPLILVQVPMAGQNSPRLA
jgi:hypothetical protein